MFSPPRPSFVPLVEVLLNDALTKLAGLPDEMSVGVGVFGTAAAYALVWELGSKKLKKPGPRTVWGVNRFGQKRIFSSQAPKGYVFINVSAASSILNTAVSSVKLDIANMSTSKMLLEIAMDNAALEIASIVSHSAPVDSGDLRSQIQSISADEAQEYLHMGGDQGSLMV